ncbi:phage tail protein [Flavihumibacter sp.]|uniref:phage tail protein n=1 Tax=Flavihumibacter sp. TaxID=1913981 RepID=UPI002FCB5A06|nr:tail fiber protein [Flavihumibacter sediminis]
MADPFLAEIRMFSFNFAPKGWAQCNGQLLAINQNQALFSLLGTTYGGNGTTNFALPDLRGRVSMHFSASFVIGQRGGETAHTLSANEMPQHNHLLSATSAIADQVYPGGSLWAAGASASAYHDASNAVMSDAVVSNTGGSQPHENMAPYTVINYSIALVGIFPSRD